MLRSIVVTAHDNHAAALATNTAMAPGGRTVRLPPTVRVDFRDCVLTLNENDVSWPPERLAAVQLPTGEPPRRSTESSIRRAEPDVDAEGVVVVRRLGARALGHGHREHGGRDLLRV